MNADVDPTAPPALRPGDRLGPYEVVRLIGSGGMGEVYEARDDRLARSVAIKVLPARLASDPHRTWRFEQEARAAAALRHPNVVAVFDVGRQGGTGGTPFIVSELLQGETLRERLGRARLTPQQAVLVLAEVARGLAAAHAAGIVHRDLKPENVFLTVEGPAKILDFGVAKLMPKNHLLADHGPTMGASVEGQVVGTVGYMAPEQVRGESVDGRADLFAVGTMLYEALAGRSPFAAASAVETLNAILTAEPQPLRDVRPEVSDALARVIHRCLEKAPAARFQSAADLAFALESSVGRGVDTEGRSRVPAPAVPGRRPRLSWVAATVVAAAGLLGAYHLGVTARPAETPPVYRFSLLPPPGTAWGSVPVVSPDGRRLAFVAVDGQQAQLYVQAIDGRTATAVPGTTGAMNPFWSPDSRRVGFMATPPGVLSASDLRVVAEDGTVSQTLWSGLGRGVAMLPDGSFVIGPTRQGLLKLSADGGSADPLTALDRAHLEYAQRWPSLLPDGRHVLYFAWASPEEHRGVYVARLDAAPDRQQRTQILRGDSNAVVVAAGDGHPALLVFERDSTLYAQRFDEDALSVVGAPVAIEREVGRLNPDHPAQFSVSPNVLVVGTDVPFASRFTLVGRDGTVGRTFGGVGISWPRVSPDGTQLLHGQLNLRSGDLDLWLLDLERDVGTRLTAQPGFSGWPVWSPDGRQVAYRYEQYSTAQLRVRSLDGGEGEDRVLDERRNLRPTDWSPDGRWIVVTGPSAPPPPDTIPLFPGGPRTGLDVLAVPAQGGDAVPLKNSEFSESEASVSPDGRLLAYVSDVSGRPEVYLDWFVVGGGRTHRPGGPWRVSPDGGDFPVWTRGGRELLYFGSDDRFYAVSLAVAGDAAPRIARPQPLQVPYGRRFFPPLSGVQYAASADGETLILTPERGKVTEPMRVTVNWRSLVK